MSNQDEVADPYTPPVTEIDLSTALRVALIGLGAGFLVANLRLVAQFLHFLRLRSTALVTWPGNRSPYYGVFLAFGVILGGLVFLKIVIQQQPATSAFGEGMMFVYYGYLLPMSSRIGRGLYEDGIWAESGFVPYSKIGGLSWREGRDITLVIIYRLRSLALPLTVPHAHYGEVRCLLRDKIAAHDLHFTLKTLGLGTDDRDRV